MKKGLLFAGTIIAVLAIIVLFMYVNISNKEVDRRNQVTAQQKACEANFDKMYKTIAQLAQIPEQYAKTSKEAFKEIYPDLISGRYQNDNGTFMKWITESNPTYDMASIGKLYEKLAVAIEANRAEFFMEQKKLISYQQEHKNILQKWPGSWLLSRDTITITIITSTYSEQVYKTGKDDNVELFGNDTTK